jgi:hypothetical protein
MGLRGDLLGSENPIHYADPTMRLPPTTVAALTLGALAAVGSLATAGCAHLGPRTLRANRFHYNQAVARSADEQMLLNLVRLRYRDNPLFLEVSSVVTHYTFGGNASAGGRIGKGSNGADVGTGIEYTEEPTVSYTPLQGKEFVTSLLTPISIDNLFLLSQTGWSVERLLLCCVQRVNGLPNAVAAAGPTPDYVPEYADFHRAAAALRRLQIAGRLTIAERKDGRWLRIEPAPPPARDDPDLHELQRLLGLDPARTDYRLVARTDGEHAPDEIAVTPRSLLAVMFFLSQAVEPPSRDEEHGLVTVTRDAGGHPFDWQQVVGPLMRIRSAADSPADASLAVFYRGRWFFIDDADRNSKTTFNLLAYLQAIQAGGADGEHPLLTLGVN